MIEKLRIRNRELINSYKDEKQILIRELLKDNDCFHKISTFDAYRILEDLGYTKNIDEIYCELLK